LDPDLKGTITKIDPLKVGSNGQSYRRLYFELANGGAWAKTDVMPDNANYRRWKDLLEVGNVLGNLMMKDNKTVDADSPVHLVSRPPKQGDLFA
jgi:hypothetical protein